MKTLRSKQNRFLLFVLLCLFVEPKAYSQMLIPGYICGNGNSDSSCFNNPNSWLTPYGNGALFGAGALRFQTGYVHPYTYNPSYNNPFLGSGSYYSLSPNAWWYMPRYGNGPVFGKEKRKGLFSGSGSSRSGGSSGSSGLFSGSGSSSSSRATSPDTRAPAPVVQTPKGTDGGNVIVNDAQKEPVVVTPDPVIPKAKEPSINCSPGYRIENQNGKQVCQAVCSANAEAVAGDNPDWIKACRPKDKDCNWVERVADFLTPVKDCKDPVEEKKSEGNVVVDCPQPCVEEVPVIKKTPEEIAEVIKEADIPFADKVCKGKENIDSQLVAEFTKKIDPIKENDIYNLAICVGASYKKGLSANSQKTCDPSGNIANAKTEPCASNAYLTAVARAITQAGKCLDINPKEIYTIMNHESRMHFNAAEALGSYGLGQNNIKAAEDLFHAQKIPFARMLADSIMGSKDCAEISTGLKTAQTSFEKGKNSFQCSLVSPKSGVAQSAALTAAYYKLLTDYYFGAKIKAHKAKADSSWIAEKKCPFDAFKDPKIYVAAKQALKGISYNAGPGLANIVLCDYMRMMVSTKQKISANSFSDTNSERSFKKYMQLVNKEFKNGTNSDVMSKYAAKIKRYEKSFTKSTQGDRVALVYTDKLLSDLDSINSSLKGVDGAAGVSCGVDPYTGKEK